MGSSYSAPAGGAEVGQLGEFYVLPEGWLKENGAVLLIADYPELHEQIGTMFGGDGITTFALNDARADFRRGWDDGRGIDAGRVLGSGQAVQTNNLAIINQSSTDKTIRTITVPEDGTVSNWGAGGTSSSSMNFQNRGVETRPRNVAVIFAIKY